jgi:hypothetical protein
MTLTKSKVTGNSAAEFGGGIWNNSTLTLKKSTVSGNIATIDAGGISNQAPGTVTLTDSKVKNNTPNDCVGC